MLLAIDAKVDDRTVESHKVVDVTFDEPLDDALFVYQATSEETIQAAIPVTQRTTLQAAASRAPLSSSTLPSVKHFATVARVRRALSSLTSVQKASSSSKHPACRSTG